MSDIAVRVENLGKMYPSTGSGQALSDSTLLSLAKDQPQVRRGLPEQQGRIVDFSGVEKFIDALISSCVHR